LVAGGLTVTSIHSIIEPALIELVAESDSVRVNWAKIYEVEGMFDALTVTGSGKIFAAGWMRNHFYSRDVLVAKFDADGSSLWAKRYDKWEENEYAADIIRDSEGKCVVVGMCGKRTSSDTDKEAFVMRLSGRDGSVLWANRYGSRDGSHSAEEARGVTIDQNGNYVVVGSWKSSRGWMFNVNRFNGALVWQRVFDVGGLLGSSGLSSVCLGGDGGFAASGYWETVSTAYMFVVKANKKGIVKTGCNIQGNSSATAKGIWRAGNDLHWMESSVTLTSESTSFTVSEDTQLEVKEEFCAEP